MRVVNLVAWAGHEFSHAVGDIVDLVEDIATARVAAGLAEPAPEPDPPAPAKRAR